MKRCVLLYLMVFTIPVFMGITAWQSIRYTALEKKTKALELNQEEWVEKNKRLIADIATLTSSEKIEDAAVDLGLSKIEPENVLQIWIEGR